MLSHNAVQHRAGYLDGFGSKIEVAFPELRKRNWSRRFWGRGYSSTTSVKVTDDIIFQ
jgi:hypothetical protein